MIWQTTHLLYDEGRLCHCEYKPSKPIKVTNDIDQVTCLICLRNALKLHVLMNTDDDFSDR